MRQAPPKEPSAPPRALRRSSQGRFLLGICAGLGRHTGIDPVVFRVAFAVLIFGSGIGLFLYIAAFLLMKDTDGRPGYIEQWTQRDFDGETVLALLTAVLGFGLAINLSTVWLGPGTVVVGLLLAVSLLAAHAGGVDLVALVRSMPERLNRRQDPEGALTEPTSPEPPPASPEAPSPGVLAPEAPVSGGTAAGSVPPGGTLPKREGLAEARYGDDDPLYAGPADGPRTVHYGEPFAPRGPYQPLDPRRRDDYRDFRSPYDPSPHARPLPRRRRPKSFIGLITMLLALVVGGIVVAVQARSGMGVSPVVVGGAVLVTIGAGLLVAAWWGRGAGLVAAGTGVALLVTVGMVAGGLPRNVGDIVWVPVTVAEARGQVYDVGMGEGRLDLSELRLAPGTDLTVNASVRIGVLTVIVPSTARVEVHATNKVGDIQVDQSLRGGVDVRFDKVLEPESRPGGDAPTIVLNLRGGLGDMEVRRAA